MNKENLQDNLKYFLTNEVENGKRVFKIVDGTHFPLNEAHVFHTGEVVNLGDSDADFKQMGDQANKDYCEWYANNRNAVRKFYEQKK